MMITDKEIIEQLTAERDAALAQVGELREEWEKKDGSDITESDKLELLVAIIYKTPAQCLAARDAEVGIKAVNTVIDMAQDWVAEGYVNAAELLDYANQLHQQAKDKQ
jgi:3-deoxy-D-manno-octulosonate 8-phosphate phosphatase KdsC-like HAD superfamily phosphatase